MSNYMPEVVHGSHAQKWANLASSFDYDKMVKHFGAVGYWNSHLDGKLIGYVEECDRDEDRIYYDHFILREYYERYKRETA
jgi:hypothetical protein